MVGSPLNVVNFADVPQGTFTFGVATHLVVPIRYGPTHQADMIISNLGK